MQDQAWPKFVLLARWLVIKLTLVYSTRVFWKALRFASCVVFVLTLVGCTSRYSMEALHAIAPSADIVDVCTRMPTVESGAVAWAHKMSSRMTVSDADWDEFERFAETADILYRYDPNAPEETAQRLPWPYQDMSCRTLSASKPPPMPEGMHAIPISGETREALIAALRRKGPPPLRKTESASNQRPFDPRYLAQNVFAGGSQSPMTTERLSHGINEVGQILRDAIRSVLPNVPTPNDGQISVIDTSEGQVIGGMGAGATISWVPGGVFIADAMQNSNQVPKPTPQFMLGQGLGQMGSGLLQIGGGGTLVAGGTGMSATGVGLVAGVPTCTAGVMLAANGTITFIHGAQTLLVAVCHWNELNDAKPLAAVAPKDAASGAPAPQSGGATTPATAPTAKPAAAPAQATPAKPAPARAKPAKPAAKPNTSSGGQTPVQAAKQCRVLLSTSGNTTTWRRCTGQRHHAISARIFEALERHPNLKGVYKHRDSRFVTQAVDKAAHNGYQTWHIELDKEIASHIDRNRTLTAAQFEAYLRQRYAEPKLKAAFPNGL